MRRASADLARARVPPVYCRVLDESVYAVSSLCTSSYGALVLIIVSMPRSIRRNSHLRKPSIKALLYISSVAMNTDGLVGLLLSMMLWALLIVSSLRIDDCSCPVTAHRSSVSVANLGKIRVGIECVCVAGVQRGE